MNNISIYKWNKFPVEYSKYLLLIVTKDLFIDLSKCKELVSHFSSIFPENNTNIVYLDRKQVDVSILLNINTSHNILISSYKDIDESILTNSDMIVFLEEDSCNSYLYRHKIKIDSFNFTDNCLVLDKYDNNISISGISKQNPSY